ncbi:MAG: BBP7 family outer membrane beta-barrel protein [Candidatus Rokuibacteriota bacterium]
MKRTLVVSLLWLPSLLLADVAGAQSASPDPAPFSISAEALLWWFKDNATPPLVTDGLLGEPGTKVYLGGRDEDTGANPGFRITGSFAVTERWGVDGSVFYVPTRSTSRHVSSSGAIGSQDLFVSIVDATIPGESVSNLSSAGEFSGRAREELSNSLLGAELNGTLQLAAGRAWRVDGLAGVRYLRLRERYVFTTSTPNIPPRPVDVYQTTDLFDTTNDFLGGQLGVRARADWGAWFATGVAKVALGAMRQGVDIEGTLVTNDFNDFGAPIAYPGGGYFAAPTNIGERSRNVFALVPEAGVTVGYRLTPSLSIVLGYTFLYASDVVRAPRQINRTVNYSDSERPPAVPAGPQEPSFRFKSSDFWAQGLSVGVAFRF